MIHGILQRKPVAMIPETEENFAMLVCDDGAVFWREDNEWRETTPVPGTFRWNQIRLAKEAGEEIPV